MSRYREGTSMDYSKFSSKVLLPRVLGPSYGGYTEGEASLVVEEVVPVEWVASNYRTAYIFVEDVKALESPRESWGKQEEAYADDPVVAALVEELRLNPRVEMPLLLMEASREWLEEEDCEPGEVPGWRYSPAALSDGTHRMVALLRLGVPTVRVRRVWGQDKAWEEPSLVALVEFSPEAGQNRTPVAPEVGGAGEASMKPPEEAVYDWLFTNLSWRHRQGDKSWWLRYGGGSGSFCYLETPPGLMESCEDAGLLLEDLGRHLAPLGATALGLAWYVFAGDDTCRVLREVGSTEALRAYLLEEELPPGAQEELPPGE